MSFADSALPLRTTFSLTLVFALASACQGDPASDLTIGAGGSARGSGGTTSVSQLTTGGTVPASNGGTSSVTSTKAASGGSTTVAGGAPTGGQVSVPVGGATGGAMTTTKAITGGSPSTGACTDTPRSSESCADAKTWGFCSQSWFTSGNYCQSTCGNCGTSNAGGAPGTGGNVTTGGAKPTGGNGNGPTGGNRPTGGNGNVPTGGVPTGGAPTGGAPTGGKATGGSNGGTTVPRLTNGKDGTTTRYWDCCKPSCGWKANAAQNGKQPTRSCGSDGTTVVGVDTQSACSGGSAYQCYSFAPWSVSDTLSYGYAATGGGNGNCGKCFQLDFTGAGDNANASALSNKTMIVQAVNIGGDVASTQFDLLIPGGGVGAFNACSNQWSTSNLGAQYGGFLTSCNYTNASCVNNYCTTVFGSKPALLAGCQWFTGWFNAANNPKIKYAEVACPAEITGKSGM